VGLPESEILVVNPTTTGAAQLPSGVLKQALLLAEVEVKNFGGRARRRLLQPTRSNKMAIFTIRWPILLAVTFGERSKKKC
jgi:hypothetical protein